VKAIMQDVYGQADVLQLRDIERPAVGANDVLVRVRAAGVDPSVWHLMTGLPYLIRMFGFGLRAPKSRVRGAAMAGVVEAVGERVSDLRAGEAVFGTCDGAFAEWALARPDKLARKPEQLGFEHAAAVPISGVTALQALRDQAKVQPGQKVLVIGAGGGVGSFAVQIARAFGAEVTAVCSGAKQELVRSIGADHVIDYTREDFTDRARHYDVILDTAGHRPLSRLRRALTRGGTLVIVGGEGGDRWLGGLGRTLRAVLLSPFVSQKLRGLVSIERKRDLEALGELIEAGKVKPVVDRTFSLSEVPDAIRYLEHGHARGKVVITV
jgi:NADPH:quinone reductase-like Zn-dependent oxidoreductase